MSTSWFDGALAGSAPALLELDRIPQGTALYVSEITGRRLAQGLDEISAGFAGDLEAQLLEIDVGSTVLLGANWFRDQSGDALEFGQSVSVPGSVQVYVYEL